MAAVPNQSEIQAICNWLVKMGITAAHDNQTAVLAQRFVELGADLEELNSWTEVAEVEGAASELFSDAKSQSNFVQKVCRGMNIRMVGPMVSPFHVRHRFADDKQNSDHLLQGTRNVIAAASGQYPQPAGQQQQQQPPLPMRQRSGFAVIQNDGNGNINQRTQIQSQHPQPQQGRQNQSSNFNQTNLATINAVPQEQQDSKSSNGDSERERENENENENVEEKGDFDAVLKRYYSLDENSPSQAYADFVFYNPKSPRNFNNQNIALRIFNILSKDTIYTDIQQMNQIEQILSNINVLNFVQFMHQIKETPMHSRYVFLFCFVLCVCCFALFCFALIFLLCSILFRARILKKKKKKQKNQ